MKKLSFYEQVGIVIPGSVLLFGLIFFFPALHNFFAKDGVTVGGLGVFVLLAYAAGHLVAALGNLIENVMWWTHGGMPSDWILQTPPKILSPSQIERIESQIKTRLNLPIKVVGASRADWAPVSRQIYADVMRHGKPARVDTFNGNYGLNRGLCASTLVLAFVAATLGVWGVAVGLLAISAIYLYRARRFGVHYARELYVQFLLLPAKTGEPKPRRPSATAR